MPTATVTLTPQEQHLVVLIENQQEDVDRLEQVVIDHLNRMAQQEFIVEWPLKRNQTVQRILILK